MTIDERIDKIIDITARHESGGDYSAWNPNDNGKGVSYGLIQFNQKVGSLPTLLKFMHEVDSQRFVEVFDWAALCLIDTGWVRATDKLGMLKDAFVEAGKWPAFQKAQRQLVRKGYFEPAAKCLEIFELYSERAHAMVFDIAVQFGVGGLRSKLRHIDNEFGFNDEPEKKTLERLANECDGPNIKGRRYRILASTLLSDERLYP